MKIETEKHEGSPVCLRGFSQPTASRVYLFSNEMCRPSSELPVGIHVAANARQARRTLDRFEEQGEPDVLGVHDEPARRTRRTRRTHSTYSTYSTYSTRWLSERRLEDRWSEDRWSKGADGPRIGWSEGRWPEGRWSEDRWPVD